MELNMLSLFSGIGAFEKALQNIGIKVNLKNFCEIDKYASQAYCAIHKVDKKLILFCQYVDKNHKNYIFPANIGQLFFKVSFTSIHLWLFEPAHFNLKFFSSSINCPQTT